MSLIVFWRKPGK